MDDDPIPDFLRRRRSDPVVNYPPVKPVPVVPVPVPAAPTPPAVELQRRKRTKTEHRLARMKQSLEANKIPPAFRRWDPVRNRLVDERVDYQRRLKAVAASLGINLEDKDVEKITIVPYHKDAILPAERGRATSRTDAQDFEIQAKVVKAANRAGLSKVDRVEVVNANGEIREVWTLEGVDSEVKMLNKVGTETRIPATIIDEEESTPMPRKAKSATKTKSKAKSAKRASNGNGNGAKRGVGVIATIIETISRDRGGSLEEILAVLTKKFPDREAEGMTRTVRIQANKNARKKDRDDKRGLVYYG